MPATILFLLTLLTGLVAPLHAAGPDTQLLEAAARGDENQVRTLLAAAASPRVSDANGRTPLHLAVAHPEVVALLLRAKALPDARDRFNRTPLMAAADVGDSATVRLLLRAGADLHRRDLRNAAPADLAQAAEHTDLARHLRLLATLTDSDINTGLRRAIRAANSDRVATLLDAGADPDASGAGGVSPLAIAAEHASPAIARQLLQAGADPLAGDAKGRTPLMLAAWSNRPPLTRLLLNAGAPLFLGAPASGEDALRVAAYLGHAPSVAAAIAAGLSPNATDVRGITPLMAAAQNGSAPVIRILLEAGADPKARDRFKATALMRAVFWGHTAAVEALLEAGADPDRRQGKDIVDLPWPEIIAAGRRALGYLPRDLKPPTARDEGNQTALMWASRAPAHTDTASAARLLAAGADLDRRDKKGRSALAWAAAQNRLALTALLLEAGASVKTRDKDKRTPLSVAAAAGAEQVLTLLLEAGADPDARDRQDNTALILAAKGGHLGVARLLLDAGADPKARNEIDQSALTWARDGRHRELYRLLTEAGARLR